MGGALQGMSSCNTDYKAILTHFIVPCDMMCEILWEHHYSCLIDVCLMILPVQVAFVRHFWVETVHRSVVIADF